MPHNMMTEWEALQAARGVEVKAHRVDLIYEPFVPAPPDMTTDQILRGLNRRHNSMAQVEAVRVLRHLAANMPEKLLALAHREADVYQQRIISGTLVSLTVVGTAGALGMLAAKLSPLPAARLDLLLYLFASISFVMAVWLNRYLPIQARKSLIEVFGTLDDPRFLGPVLSILIPDGITASENSTALNAHVRLVVTGALRQMLAHIRADQSVLLTREQMQALLKLLAAPYSAPDLTVSILRALQQIGDESAIPVVEWLARDSGTNISAAAEECLPYLRSRADQQRHSQTLLRASDATETVAPNALLRPAESVPDTAPEQLLRPQL